MNSSVYKCTVIHRRTAPKKHAFKYNLFMTYLDLDELDSIGRNSLLIARNRFAPFEFRDQDHYQLPGKGLRSSLCSYLNSKGVTEPIGRIFLLTHLRTWGHLFNPVSFYFITDQNGKSIGTIAEVGNTFHEQKLYFVPSNDQGISRANPIKLFYVSPFSDLDTRFHFRIAQPTDRLRLSINQSKNGVTYFNSVLTGKRRPLNDRLLAAYALRFPFLTLQIVGAIHWQAFKLHLKGVPFHRKADNPHLQTETRPYLTAQPLKEN